MGIGNRIKEARINLGYTQEDLAKILGVTKGAVANYEVETSHPKEPIMYKLFDALKVDANYLFQDEMGSNYPMKVSYNEMEHIKKYRFISTHSPDGASVVDTVLDREYAIAQQLDEKNKEIKELKKEPISKRILAYYGKIAAAGKSYGFDDVIAGTIECPLTEESQRADYSIGVSGDSMEPTYFDGDVVYVQKTTNLNIGDIGIFQKDNGIYIKEVGENELISHNTEHKPILNNGDILCLGKVIGKATGIEHN